MFNDPHINAQRRLLEEFVKEHTNENDVVVDYYFAYAQFPCLRVTCGKYLFEMSYKPQKEIDKNEIRTNVYFMYVDDKRREDCKCFMMKRDVVPSELDIFSRSRYDYHFLPVSYSNWASKMIAIVNWIRNNYGPFIELCRVSSPYNDDGTHKFKSWKTFAKVEIVRYGDNRLVQGIKCGGIPDGSHVVGSNGSFIVFHEGSYGLQYTVERLAGEKPRRGYPTFIEMDKYLRQLRDKLGYVRKMPVDLFNSKLPDKVDVITYDMNKDPDQREFIPVGYEGDWFKFVQECFKDL